jgi:organic radical activating enzyme
MKDSNNMSKNNQNPWSQTFCPVPWNFQAIQNNGAVRVCCQMNVTPEKGTLIKDDGTPYNAGVDKLEDARNAQLIKDVRAAMLKGEWHKNCGRCQREEQAGLNSRRSYELNQWPLRHKHVLRYTDEDGTIDQQKQKIVSYDLRFGNMCNLSCRMCGVEDSHTWYNDHVAITGETSWRDTHGVVTLEKNQKGRWYTNAYDWHHSDSFWEQMDANMTNMKHVYLAGGEPMMIERHFEFLQRCIDTDNAYHINLEYNTNMTNIPDRVLKMWTHFKRVSIGASVDGMGAHLEMQRYPAKWSHIEKNLRKIDELPSNIYAWISCTVTNYNIFHMPDFMHWKLEQGFKKINIFDKSPIMSYHMCHRPWSATITVLPQEIKKQVVEHYESKRGLFDKYDSNTKFHANKQLDAILKFMNNHDDSNQFRQFLEWGTKLDKLRGQNISDLEPVYKPYIEEYLNGKD